MSLDRMLADAGVGVDDIDSRDLAIPFLSILQALSPQLNKHDGSYVPGAEAGDIIHTVTHEIWKDGVSLVPCVFQRRYTEWLPRTAGGGLVHDYGSDESCVQQATARPTGGWLKPNGNEIVLSGNHFCLLLRDDGTFDRVVVSMSATQYKKSRRWNTMITATMIQTPDGLKPAPVFARCYHVSTIPESNEKGSWYGWRIEPGDWVLNLQNGPALYDAAKAFRTGVLNQAYRADVQIAHAPAAPALADDVPF